MIFGCGIIPGLAPDGISNRLSCWRRVGGYFLFSGPVSRFVAVVVVQ